MTRIAKKFIAVLLVVSLMMALTLSALAAEPIRQTFESAGATVTWDYQNHLIVIEISGNTIVLEPGSYTALVNDTAIALSRPVFIENGVSFMEMYDLTALSMALMGIDSVDGEHGLSVATARAMAAEFMEAAAAPDFSMAIVNARTGFSWTDTMSEATDADTIFHLGSIAKTFTAVAVMQLVEQGLLDLDTPIVEYIPEFKTQPSIRGEGNYQNITARMLLSHTSGIYTNDFGTGAITYGGHYQYHLNDFLARFARTRMVRQEGTAFEYANTGFVLLGILVARIAGHDNYFEGFNSHMLEHVFEPMGLRRTSYIVTSELRQYVAQPYSMTGMPQEFQYWNVLPTGTMFSTANEMVSLMTMFLNNGYYNGAQILSQESIDKMFTDQSGTGQYGLGIAFMGDPAGSGAVAVGHNGGMIYNFAAMFIDREHGLAVFSATNSTSSAGANEVLAGAVLATAIAEVGGELQPPVSHIDLSATPIELSAEELEALSGLYLLAGGMMHLFVDLVEGRLYIRAPAQGLNIALTPMSDGHFSTELTIPFWLIPDGDDVFFVQGPNRYAIAGVRTDPAQFIPDEDFMDNWYGYTFVGYKARDFYVLLIPQMTFGVTAEGFAYVEVDASGMTIQVLESMEQDFEVFYENGELFFYYFGIRFVRE